MKNGIKLQDSIGETNEGTIIMVIQNGHNSMREVGMKSIKCRNRRQTANEKTDTDLDIVGEPSQLQLHKPHPPFGHIIGNATRRTR